MRPITRSDLLKSKYTSLHPISEIDDWPQLVFYVSDQPDDILNVHGATFLVTPHEAAVDLSRKYGAFPRFTTTWLDSTDSYEVSIFWDPE